MCQDIAANQTAEIETMQAWLQDWYGIAYEPDMQLGFNVPPDEPAMARTSQITFMYGP